MTKLLSALVAAAFAVVSLTPVAFAEEKKDDKKEQKADKKDKKDKKDEVKK